MRVVTIIIGTRGDIQPQVALSRGLIEKGHEACIVAPKNYSDFVTGYGVEFFPLSCDFKGLIDSDLGKKVMTTGSMGDFISFEKMREKEFENSGHEALEACKGADFIIYTTIFPGGKSIAEKLNIPCAEAILQPMSATGEFPPLLFETKGQNSRFKNKLLHRLADTFGYLYEISEDNKLRKRIGMKPCNIFNGNSSEVQILYAFSEYFLKRPSDWGNNLHVTGFWMLEDNSGWRPSEDLQNFLNAGKKPIYIGFGSTISDNPQKDLETIGRALDLSGERGIVISGWQNFGDNAILPKNIYLMKGAPFDKLFPLVTAAVHAGGAGTFSAAIKAGIPSVIVPHTPEQRFWGACACNDNIAVKAIPFKELTAEKLAGAIKTVLEDDSISRSVKAMSEKAAREDGVKNAVSIIEKLVRESKQKDSAKRAPANFIK